MHLLKIKIIHRKLIVVLLMLLPLIDTLNGICVKVPIGQIYKVALCTFLFIVLVCESGRIKSRHVIELAILIFFIFFSIGMNLILGGTLINKDFPIKLIFNILIFLLLMESVEKKYISDKDIYQILSTNTWLLIACFLIPYAAGIGNKVYSDQIGYKAFFISQNELSFTITILAFFTSYQIVVGNEIIDTIKLALIILCGIILNTKTAIISSLIALALWFIPTIIRSKTVTKLLSVGALLAIFYLLKDKMLNAIMASISRFNTLTYRYYGGSKLSGVLSNRNMFAKEAWNDLSDEHFTFKFFFGNGFCSNYLVEMDLVDVFFYLGVLGLLITIFFCAKVLKRTFDYSKLDQSHIRPISFIVLIFLSSFAGHVIFMSMSGFYFAIYCCFLLEYKKTDFPDKEKRMISDEQSDKDFDYYARL